MIGKVGHQTEILEQILSNRVRVGLTQPADFIHLRYSASKCAPTTVHGGGRPSACCISVVSFKPAPSASSRWGPSRSSLAPRSLPSRTLRAAQARWPPAILDRGCARHLGVVRPGRRNGPFRPNQETPQVVRAVTAGKGSLASTHAKQRGGQLTLNLLAVTLR